MNAAEDNPLRSQLLLGIRSGDSEEAARALYLAEEAIAGAESKEVNAQGLAIKAYDFVAENFKRMANGPVNQQGIFASPKRGWQRVWHEQEDGGRVLLSYNHGDDLLCLELVNNAS